MNPGINFRPTRLDFPLPRTERTVNTGLLRYKYGLKLTSGEGTLSLKLRDKFRPKNSYSEDGRSIGLFDENGNEGENASDKRNPLERTEIKIRASRNREPERNPRVCEI